MRTPAVNLGPLRAVAFHRLVRSSYFQNYPLTNSLSKFLQCGESDILRVVLDNRISKVRSGHPANPHVVRDWQPFPPHQVEYHELPHIV
jgi:hypothetical protein